MYTLSVCIVPREKEVAFVVSFVIFMLDVTCILY